MSVIIKENGDYYRVPIDRLLSGVETEEDIGSRNRVRIPINTNILSIQEDGNVTIVEGSTGSINRKVEVSGLNRVIGNIVRVLGVYGIGERSVQEWLNYIQNSRTVNYRTKKGFIFRVRLARVSNGYRVVGGDLKFSWKDYGQSNAWIREVIYPNIYDNNKVCIGSGSFETISGLDEVGKLYQNFFAAKVNGDLDNIRIKKAGFDRLMSHLNDLPVRQGVEMAVQENVQDLVRTLHHRDIDTGGGWVAISILMLVYLGDIYDMDMGDMHKLIYL